MKPAALVCSRREARAATAVPWVCPCSIVWQWCRACTDGCLLGHGVPAVADHNHGPQLVTKPVGVESDRNPSPLRTGDHWLSPDQLGGDKRPSLSCWALLQQQTSRMALSLAVESLAASCQRVVTTIPTPSLQCLVQSGRKTPLQFCEPVEPTAYFRAVGPQGMTRGPGSARLLILFTDMAAQQLAVDRIS